LLDVCHLLNTPTDLLLILVSFQGFPDGEPIALFSFVSVRRKGLKEIEE